MSRSYDNFHSFLCKLVKECNAASNITAEAKDTLNGLVYNICEQYAINITKLCKYANKITLDSNAVITMTRIWLRRDSEPVLEYAHTVWDTYSASTLKGTSKYNRAGIKLPPSRIKNIIHDHILHNQKIGETCYIFLTAIIEYIIKKVVQTAIELANNKLTITGLLLYNALNSTELEWTRVFFKNTFLAGFGIVGDQLLLDAQAALLDKRNLDSESSHTEPDTESETDTVTDSDTETTDTDLYDSY